MNWRFAGLLGILSAVVLTVSLLSLRLVVGDIPVAHATASGEALSPLALATGERIEIDYSNESCRSWHNWAFVLFGGSEPRLVAIDAGGSYEAGEKGSDRPSAVGAIALSERECRGMRDLLELYRRPDPQAMSTTTIRIRVSYYRGAERVGTEEFIDHGAVDNWLYQRDNYGQVPISAGVTPDMISFRHLMRRAAGANQTPELTTHL